MGTDNNDLSVKMLRLNAAYSCVTSKELYYHLGVGFSCLSSQLNVYHIA